MAKYEFNLQQRFLSLYSFLVDSESSTLTSLSLLKKTCHHFLSQHASPWIVDSTERQTHSSSSRDQLCCRFRGHCSMIGLSVSVSFRLSPYSVYFSASHEEVHAQQMCGQGRLSILPQWFLLFDQSFDQTERVPWVVSEKKGIMFEKDGVDRVDDGQQFSMTPAAWW